MKRVAKAKIKWLPASKGGRKAPPIGPQYATVVHFENDVQPNAAWSMVIEFEEFPNESLETNASVWFLSEEAPHYLLQTGNQFELFEGRQVVARGEILSSPDE